MYFAHFWGSGAGGGYKGGLHVTGHGGSGGMLIRSRDGVGVSGRPIIVLRDGEEIQQLGIAPTGRVASGWSYHLRRNLNASESLPHSAG